MNVPKWRHLSQHKLNFENEKKKDLCCLFLILGVSGGFSQPRFQEEPQHVKTTDMVAKLGNYNIV